MREYELPYDLKDVGLRRDYRNPISAPGLVECFNAKPTPFGMVGVDNVTNPIDEAMKTEGIEVDWPYPQLYIGKNYTWLMTRDKIYSVTADWDLVHEADIFVPSDYGWSVADFGTYNLFTNRSQVIAMLNGDYTVDLPTGMSDVPYGVTEYRSRLVTAGPSNLVSWSEIGSTTMTPSRKNTAGYRPLPWRGTCFMVKRLGDFVVAYGTGGITAFKSVGTPAPTLAMIEIENNFGVVAVAGNKDIHYCIDTSGEMWSLSADLKKTKEGYKEFFEDMGTIVGSFDSLEGDAYFSDGEDTYIKTPVGLGATNQMLTSVGRYQGSLYGVFSIGNNFGFKVVTDSIDFGTRAIKNLQVIEITGELPNALYCSVDWRSNKKNDYRESVQKRVNKEGVVYPQIAGVDMRVILSSSYWEDTRVSGLSLRWKATDRRAIRGISNVNKAYR